MKPSISVIAAARRFFTPANLLRWSFRVSRGKRSGLFYSLGSSWPPLSSLYEGMLTRCSAPTFMEMHPLIYPSSACSRLCLTSVLREVYHLPSERDLLVFCFLPFAQIPTIPTTSPSVFRPHPSDLASHDIAVTLPSMRLARKSFECDFRSRIKPHIEKVRLWCREDVRKRIENYIFKSGGTNFTI